MILVDQDLDTDAGPRASPSKRAPSTRSTPTDRHSRVPSVRTLTRFLSEAQAAVRLRGQVSVLLTTDRNIRRLNRQFRGKNKATDVLSFPADPLVRSKEKGDLAVSVPTALRQAREQGHPLGIELKVLILHGLLHLAGFDHETDNGEMARRECLLRARLGLPEGLIERTHAGVSR
jgi:probable rRNA maturation factor